MCVANYLVLQSLFAIFLSCLLLEPWFIVSIRKPNNGILFSIFLAISLFYFSFIRTRLFVLHSFQCFYFLDFGAKWIHDKNNHQRTRSYYVQHLLGRQIAFFFVYVLADAVCRGCAMYIKVLRLRRNPILLCIFKVIGFVRHRENIYCHTKDLEHLDVLTLLILTYLMTLTKERLTKFKYHLLPFPILITISP